MVKSVISLEDLIPEEQTAVMQLKQRMNGQMDPDLYEDLNLFVRFLRARNLNVNASEAMLKQHIEWRKKLQIRSILKNYTPKEVCSKYFPITIMGVDKEGAPILYLDFGKIDSRGILKSARKTDIYKCILQKLEQCVVMMREQSLKRGILIDKLSIMINFDGLSLAVCTHKETLQFLAHLIMIYESNYPERLKTGYFINTSPYFTMAFGVVKHIFSGKTLNKIQIFARDGWKEELLRRIHPEDLPAFLGGERTSPDGNPLCSDYIIHGVQVPESYYVKQNGINLAKLPGTEKVVVTRKSKSELVFNIKDPGSYIEWEFETSSRDIGFAVLYKEDCLDMNLELLLPKQRIETNLSSETGMMKCERPGIYIIEFDNSYSWLHKKEVYYKISVVKKAMNDD